MVKLEASWSGLMEQCAICHGEDMIGSEAKRMHYDHVFHRDCIVSGLGAESIVSTMSLWSS